MSFALSHTELTFPKPDTNNVVTLSNHGQEEASFKVRMTHPSFTTARPSKGVVSGNGTASFEVVLKGDLAGLTGEAPRMLVQCFDAQSNVIWKQRLPMHVTDGNGAQPNQAKPAETTNSGVFHSDSDASPLPSPVSAGPTTAFSITVQIKSLTSPVALSGGSYLIDWKRSPQNGSTKAVGSSGNSVVVNETVQIGGCTTVYKEGKPLRKHLVFTVMEDGAAIGTVKIQASEYSAETMEGDVPCKLTIGGVVHTASLGLVVSMTPGVPAGNPVAAKPAAAVPAQPAAATQNRPPPAQKAAPSTSGGRSFIDVSAIPKAAPATTMDSENHYNPLEDALTPISHAPLDQNIQVLVRVRPGEDNVWRADPDACTISDDEKSHNFDRVIDHNSCNMDVWNLVGMRFIDAVTSGINGTIFMYGQTGSGKTHTMFGSPEEPGLTKLLFSNLFQRIQSLTQPGMSFKVQAMYFEVYNEQVNDLLVNDSKKGRDLKIRDKGDQFTVPDLVVRTVQSMSDCTELLEAGGRRKVMGYSTLNTDSSRSHTIFSIQVICDMNQNGKKVKKTASLNFCDLAGSESMNSEGDQKQRKETQNINKSLTFLKQVITELASKSKHIAYRNSALTRILKQSLGGNAKTSIIITIHPGREQQKDSRHSLWFGATARTVKNRAKINQKVDDQGLRPMIKRLQGELATREEELEMLRRVRDDYVALQEEYTAVTSENEMLRSGASVSETMEKRYLSDDPAGPHQPEGSEANMTSAPIGNGQSSGREESLLKKLSEKDREIIDLKLGHSKELITKTRQLQRALAEQEQEETAIELMQKDDRLDKLVHEILSYLHYGTKVTRIEKKGSPERRLLYLVTDEGQQYACVCPLSEDQKGMKDTILEKIPMKEVKRTLMGQYGPSFETSRSHISQQFDQSFSIVGKKGKRIDIVCDTPSDFEAWIQSLNHLTQVRAEWGEAMDITGMDDVDKLDTDERALCGNMHIMPIDYMHARSQVVNKEGKFVTLFDVRTLSCLDMYHSQKLFGFFMSKGWIGQRKLYYLDTEMISKTPGVYEIEYEDDDEEEEETAGQPYHNTAHPAYSHGHPPMPNGGGAAATPSSYG